MAPPEQTCPAGVQLPTPLAVANWHTPRAAPGALLQTPPQQSTSRAHASPSCLQNDGLAHRPPEQYCEQHSVAAVHGLPAVLQVTLSGAHVPFVHCPPQHSPLTVHGLPSCVHVVALHFPLMQLPLQQSVPAAHVAFAEAHPPPP
jgi:hypothetical protein